MIAYRLNPIFVNLFLILIWKMCLWRHLLDVELKINNVLAPSAPESSMAHSISGKLDQPAQTLSWLVVSMAAPLLVVLMLTLSQGKVLVWKERMF
jgi:hypothetical protein